MEFSDVKKIAKEGILQGKRISGKIEETHISWVILTRQQAFKIKRPIKLSFLDFSTLRLRKYYCEKELALNSRFTDIYQKVVTVSKTDNQVFLDSKTGNIVDYAVQMKRLQTTKRMDILLKKKKVAEEDILSLSETIASFHQKAEKINTPFHISDAKDIFNDIQSMKVYVKRNLGSKYGNIVQEAIIWSNKFLVAHSERIQQRIDLGFKRDLHGDLHSGNIFLYKEPVLFDCIDFDDAYREIDLLYEIAFLCMDLEAYGNRNLSKYLLENYNNKLQCIEGHKDQELFLYFKALRANVRAKVNALHAQESKENSEAFYYQEETRKYLKLLSNYQSQLDNALET